MRYPLGLLAVSALAMLAACSPPQDSPKTISVADALGGQDVAAFEKALVVRPLLFPRDHGAHPTFRNEWWYFTGNVEDSHGREFGYQVTFFRIGLSPDKPQRKSAWATNQLWMAHAAITDVQEQKHQAAERFSRGSPGLAGASVEPFRVWQDDWQLSASSAASFPWALNVNTEHFALSLDVTSNKPPVLNGQQGLSRKSDTPGNASYYYSFTRLATTGELILEGERYSVTGLSWLDREWSSGALDKNQVGWDWFSLQLEDGQELMYYQLRDREGQAHPASAGTWVDGNGDSRGVSLDEVRLEPLEWWQSEDGTRFPIRWRLKMPQSERDWTVRALVKNQQMALLVNYWEGAVEVLDTASGKRLGKGYLEMTGY